jgi:hypothetical protein
MDTFTRTKDEKIIRKICSFLSVPENLLRRRDPDLFMKMIDAADDDQMFAVHHLGLDMKGRF